MVTGSRVYKDMKTFDFLENCWRQAVEAEPLGLHVGCAADPQSDPQSAARHIVTVLLEEEPQSEFSIMEVTVYRPRRSTIWVATFTGPMGGQIWRTTGVANRAEALRLAKQWEQEARIKRAQMGIARKLGIRVRSSDPTAALGLSQKEVARILHMSERAVRAVEARAFRKLRRHPALRQLWREYFGRELAEESWRLTPAEITALFDVAVAAEEIDLIEKVVRIIQG